MSILHSIRKNQQSTDIQYQLFIRYTLITGLLSLVFSTINAINLRPMINVTFGLIAFSISMLAYFFAKNPDNYSFSRLTFILFFTFVFVPFGYITSPGSNSAFLYLILLSIFITSSIAVRKWEYLFPLITLAETMVLIRTELWFPDWYYKYSDPLYRINDISLNYFVVALSILATLFYFTNHFKKNHDLMYSISITDSLTNLYNRRYFFDFAESEYNRSIRQNQLFSIVFIDLNNFKALNDTYGHLRGDQVLEDIASIIITNIRSYDIAARYGGDEFIIILPDTNVEEAKNHVKRLKHEFSIYAKQYQDKNFEVAVGYADSKDKSLEEVVNIADQKLYDNKKEAKEDYSS